MSQRLHHPTFLRLLAGSLILVLAAMSAPASARTTVKMATLVPDGSAWDKILKDMGAEWQTTTGGEVSLRIYAGGVAGDEPDILRKMRIGQLQGAMLSVSGLSLVDPALQVFQIPLLYRDDDELRHVMESMTPVFERRLEERGFVLVHWSTAGWLRIFSREPFDSLEEFKGLKQFVWGGGSKMTVWYRELGFDAVPLASTDVLAALQTGLIDALPSTPLAALSLQWFRSAPYMLEHRIAPLVGAFVATQRGWSAIPSASRPAVLEAARRSGDFLLVEVAKQGEQAIVAMEERGLVPIRADTDTNRDRWQAITDHFARRMLENDVPREIFDRVEELLAEYRARRAERGSD